MHLFHRRDAHYAAVPSDTTSQRLKRTTKILFTGLATGLLSACALVSWGSGLVPYADVATDEFMELNGIPRHHPLSQCSKVALKSDLDTYIARCHDCAYASGDSVTIDVNTTHKAPWAQWKVVRVGPDRVALQADTGRFLSRCSGCIEGASFKDSAFVHVPNWQGSPAAQWQVQIMPNGKVALKSDTGRYLTRCQGCAPGQPTNRAFVHFIDPHKPRSQWTVECIDKHSKPETSEETVKCHPRASRFYRLSEGKLRWYPNPRIAKSWDPNWENFKIIDCKGLPFGPRMSFHYPAPSEEGQAVKCHPRRPQVFRFTEGKLRLYPNPTIAESWDPNWRNATLANCEGIPRGPRMQYKYADPPSEGEAVKCHPRASQVFRFTDGRLRWYPNPRIAKSWDPNWQNFKIINCRGLPRGPHMPYNYPAPSKEGEAVKCHPRRPQVFRFTEGKLRWYPNPRIAQSWDPNWRNATLANCEGIPRGPSMRFNYPLPSIEGQAVKCHPHRPQVYRYTRGELRWYPNPRIAQSWDPYWRQFTVVNCATIPKGPDMAMKGATATLARQLKQLSFDGSTLCGVTRDEDIYCSTTNIRTHPVWRRVPGKLIHVVKCGARLYGVNQRHDILTGSAFGVPNWRQLPGSLKQLSCDGHQLCGVTKDDDIYCADSNLDSQPTWRKLPGKMKQVEIAGDLLFGVKSSNSIYVAQSGENPVWKQLPGQLSQVSYDGEQLCGVTLDHEVYCANENLQSSPNWTRLNGKSTCVALHGSDLFGVDPLTGVFHREVDSGL